MTGTDFIAEARRQLEAEDKAVFDRRVRERATRLAEQHRQQTAGLAAFPHDLAGRKARLDLLLAREARLAPPALVRPPGEYKQRVPRVLAASEEEELRHLRAQIDELSKLCRRDGTLPREAA